MTSHRFCGCLVFDSLLKKKKRVKEGRKEGNFFFKCPKWPEMIVIKMLEQYYFKKDCAWAGAK